MLLLGWRLLVSRLSTRSQRQPCLIDRFPGHDSHHHYCHHCHHHWQDFKDRFHYLGHLPQFHQVPSREVGTVRKGSGNVRRSPWKKLSRKRQKRWTLNYDSLVILNHLNFKSKFSGHLKHSNFKQSKFPSDHLMHLDWLLFLKTISKIS